MQSARLLALLKADFGATCEFDLALLRLLRQGRGRARIYARLSDVPRGPKGAGGRGREERKGNPLTRRPSSSGWRSLAGQARGSGFLGNPLISLKNPWKILGKFLELFGFSLELTLISLSGSSLFKGLRGPLGRFFVPAPIPPLELAVRRPAAVK